MRYDDTTASLLDFIIVISRVLMTR